MIKQLTIRDAKLGSSLVTNSQEVKMIDDYLGQKFTSQHGYFVEAKNGDYTYIALFDGNIPFLSKKLIIIKEEI